MNAPFALPVRASDDQGALILLGKRGFQQLARVNGYRQRDYIVECINSHAALLTENAELRGCLQSALNTADFEKHALRSWHPVARALLSKGQP